MQGPAIGLLGFAAVVLLIVLRVPVGVAMGVVGAIGYGFVYGFSTLGFVLGRAPFDAVFPVSLSVVPLFVMMGVFAGHGGLSKSLYSLVASFIGHFRGGLAMATIGASALFGAVCGSSIATAATIGRIALPEMRRHHYEDRLAAASVAAGGTLGVMIPPSIMFVIYGLMTENPIGKLFVAGILPGLLGMLLYMGAVAFLTRRHPEIGPAAERHSWAERLRGVKDVWQVVLLFGVVLGGMYLGWSPLAVLLALCVFYVLLGCLMDSLSMILLTLGAVYPLVGALGLDPIWFGVLLVTLAEIGMITPPVGMNLFVLQGVAGIRMEVIARGILPFVGADVVRIALLIAFPLIATWLPGRM